MNRLFPIFLKLETLHTLVVGGGYVGLEKISALLDNSPEARITLVAPEISQEIRALAGSHPNLQLVMRAFKEDDLQDRDLVIVATNDKALNREIQAMAKKKKLLCNVADTPELCDFYLSSIVQKGNLKIAISTNGLSPTAAKRIKAMLQESFPDDIDNTLNNLQQIRNYLQGDFSAKVAELNRITDILIREKKHKNNSPS